MTTTRSLLDAPTVVLDATGQPLTLGEAYVAAEAAARAAGAPDPRACADRYLQGLERRGFDSATQVGLVCDCGRHGDGVFSGERCVCGRIVP